MNIYEKLLEVRKTVPYLRKDAENKFHNFSYVSSNQCLAALKASMDEQGLLLVPRITEIKVSDHATKNDGHEYFTQAWIEYEWIDKDDPTTSVKCMWYGQGLDAGEKGVGKAVTYSEKYFLLKFFNIPTDKDDPDAFEARQGKGNGKKQPKKELPGPNKGPELITTNQHAMLSAKLKTAGIERPEAKAFLNVSKEYPAILHLTELTKDRVSGILDKWDMFVDACKKARGIK